MQTKILVPLDPNLQDDYWLKMPLEMAVEVAQTMPDPSILLMSAIPYHFFEGYYPDIYKHEMAEQTKEKLKAFAKQYCPPGTRIDVCVEEGGSISSDILKVAREQSIDVIVMASHSPKMKDYLFGSHASHVALHAPCSVFVVRKETGRWTGSQENPVLKRILVPIDTSYKSDAWLKTPLKIAYEMAQKSRASMHALSVIPSKYFEGYYPDTKPAIKKSNETLEAIIGELCSGEVSVEMSVEEGAISPTIIKIAHEQSIDVIVMASHGPIIKDYFIGSNAAHVALHAPCSVFIIRGES